MGQAYTQERNDLVNKTLSDRRNASAMFVKSNTYQFGLNLLSNRLRKITNSIKKTPCHIPKACSKHLAKLILCKVVCEPFKYYIIFINEQLVVCSICSFHLDVY